MKITNTTIAGNGIRVFVSYEGKEESYLFPLDKTAQEIKEFIENRAEEIREIESRRQSLIEELNNLEL